MVVATSGNVTIPGALYAGTSSSSTSAFINIARVGDNLEFGHPSSGYRSTLGARYIGNSYVAFNAQAGTNNDTFKTAGIRGSILEGDLGGGFSFKSVASANADNQSPSVLATLDNVGNFRAYGNYVSADNTPGVTCTVCTSVKNGICVAGHN